MRATASLPIALVVATTIVVVATIRDARDTAAAVAAPVAAPVLPASMPGTSREELTRTVADMTARISATPDDAAAVIHAADALIRLQRVNNDGRAVIAAEAHLRKLLALRPGHYEAQRMLAAVLLSQHRFGEAIAAANRASAADPNDAWNYGAIGDGYMELGDYDRAFAAYDRMGRLAPGPAAYARTAYALEIKGDLPGALEYMQRAADGTTPNDAESQAWHFAQAGDLLMQMGRVAEARLQYERAQATFPNHPLAVDGLARIRIVDGDLKGARLMLQTELAKTPTPDLAIGVGDLSTALGDTTGAEAYYRMAEQIERAGWENGPAQPQALAKFLVDHDRKLEEAVLLAELAARARRDIYTMDTLAFAYFKSGRLAEARQASADALRTGSRDARILWHAAEIRAAAGESPAALALLDRVASPATVADLRVRAGLAALRSRLANQAPPPPTARGLY